MAQMPKTNKWMNEVETSEMFSRRANKGPNRIRLQYRVWHSLSKIRENAKLIRHSNEFIMVRSSGWRWCGVDKRPYNTETRFSWGLAPREDENVQSTTILRWRKWLKWPRCLLRVLLTGVEAIFNHTFGERFRTKIRRRSTFQEHVSYKCCDNGEEQKKHQIFFLRKWAALQPVIRNPFELFPGIESLYGTWNLDKRPLAQTNECTLVCCHWPTAIVWSFFSWPSIKT